MYEARSILLVGESLSGPNPDYNQLLVSQRPSTTYAAIAGTRPVLEKVIAAVGLEDSPESLSRRVQVNTTADSSLLTIVARDGSPARAAAIANALGRRARQRVACHSGSRGRFAVTLIRPRDAPRADRCDGCGDHEAVEHADQDGG